MQAKYRHAAIAGFLLAGAIHVWAQRGGGDWMTLGYDAQRSNWVRGDGKISLDTMSKAGFQFLWKLKLNSAPRQMQSVTPGPLLDFYISYRGFRTLGFFGGAAGTVTGIDTDLGRLEWEKKLSPAGGGAGTVQCPGGMTTGVTRPTFAGYASNMAGFGRGRGGPAKSGVGEPHEGAVTLKQAPQQFPFPPPQQKGARRTAPAANPFARTPLMVDTVTVDGKFHAMYVSNGEEPEAAVQFVPANANAVGLLVFDNVAYVATVNGCGGVTNGLWALDLKTKAVSSWKSNGSPVGQYGFAAGPEGMLYVAAGNEVTALEPGTLRVTGTYNAGSALTSSPVVFDNKGKDLVAVTAADGALRLLDGTSLKEVAKTAPFSSGDFSGGALASWQDASNARWILAPAGGASAGGAGFSGNGDVKSGAIVAWKVVDKDGGAALEPGWVSRDMMSPLAPIVVNGVVFAVASGEYRTKDASMSAAARAQRSSKAVLYALDPSSGKELWNSGATITSFVTTGGMSAGGGRVYVGGHDGTQYAFGFYMEH
ncbi:MAG: hypothetical protein U0Q16_12200 [Bryobacteraceae bacterium]